MKVVKLKLKDALPVWMVASFVSDSWYLFVLSGINSSVIGVRRSCMYYPNPLINHIQGNATIELAKLGQLGRTLVWTVRRDHL